MIRPDPDRVGVYVVDVSEPILQSLRDGWSVPVQHRIEDDELVFRALDEVEAETLESDDLVFAKLYRIPSSRGDEVTD